MAELEHAYSSGDVTLLRGLSDSKCTVCARYIDSVKKRYGAGGRYVQTDWDVSRVTALGIDGNTGRYVRVWFAGRTALIGEDKSGLRKTIEDPGPGHLTYLFRLHGHSWKLQEQSGRWVAGA